MSDTPNDEALDLYGKSRDLSAEKLRKLIMSAISSPSFDLYVFAKLIEEEVEGGNPLHVVLQDDAIRAAKIFVRASDLFTEAVASAVSSDAVRQLQSAEIEAEEIIDENESLP